MTPRSRKTRNSFGETRNKIYNHMRCGGYGYRCRCENVGGIGEPVTCQTLWLRRRPFLITLSSSCRRERACTGGPISTINTSLTSFREGTGLLGAYRFPKTYSLKSNQCQRITNCVIQCITVFLTNCYCLFASSCWPAFCHAVINEY